MPTSRPRHFVTETDELAAALDAAARRFPGVSRSQLIVRLALAGRESVEGSAATDRLRRVAALKEHAGVMDGVYGPDALRELRDDWPT